MKILNNYPILFLAFLFAFIFNVEMPQLHAQDVKKSTVRLKADYYKIMDGDIYFDLAATARVDGENITVPNIDLILTNEFNGEEVELGTTTTNKMGKSKYILKSINELKPDSLNIYTVNVSFKGNEKFKRASRTVSFKDASITASIITKDSINYVSAIIKETSTDSLLSDQYLNVQVQRLFRPLRIGEEFNSTDKNGTIIVPVAEGIPGIDGNLIIEVVLLDSDDYGTVKAIINAPLGKPIVEESTFDQRTMWSPRGKTPLFLLIFPNLIIFGMWGLIIYLFINLFKISKS
ncbi:hypothetical protein RXV94_02450 [Yeosuana sp. MJ-SS3]|jgi:hypothetical protein|uniref:Protein BatD n=1 Tax=Gilvirhabdus luticola TaxID=3079858 RepID=A0ABU3U3M0_9FLAO|nr:hypothetical protein [Yeosuana sp. MJ-SS3]MDU8885005.1 hypothetical protein [Yeosuana sp. MJ-SS3]